jgi:endo-1,4-beta-xylanase
MFHHFTRKRSIAILLPLLLMVLVGSTFLLNKPPRASAAATTLGAAAAASGRVFGTAVAAGNLNISQYTNVLSTQFNGLTPENEMKWDTTEPSQNSFNFSSADTLVSYAQSHNMKIRGHTLVWYSQLPGWVSNLSGSSTVLSAMNNHITQEMTHFKGKIWYWDVVNEAFNEDGSRRSDVFQNQIGNNYIANAFTTAHSVDPNAKLCINDYNIEGQNAKSNAVYSLVQSLKSSGVPIDCVGFQSHLIVGQVPSDFQANLQRFAALGVDVQLTELDIRMPTPASSANLQQQASDYSKVISACMAVSRCTDMTVWGVDDGHSWVPNTFSGQGAALLFDANYQQKPAFTSVLAALNSGTPVPTPTNTPVVPPTNTPVVPPTNTPTATATSQPGTPTPTPTQGPGGACKVTYSVNQWNTGFTANITIANTGTAAVNGWTLKFAFPTTTQSVTQGWSATYSQSGQNVTATNLSYNGNLAAGTSTTIGFNGSWSGSNPSPTSFTLNGSTCTNG